MTIWNKYSRGDGLTCTDRLLRMFGDNDWHSTDEMAKLVGDPRTTLYFLRNDGYILEKHNEREHGFIKRGSKAFTYFRLLGRKPEVHRVKQKRGYMRDFTTDELISELWGRSLLSTVLFDGEPKQIINYDNGSTPSLCAHTCCS